MESHKSQWGLFVSYDENRNANFHEAVDISNAHKYVIWLEKSAVNIQRFSFPTTILIKIKGEDRYYRGKLTDIKRVEEMDRDEIRAEASHRPVTWRWVDTVDSAKFKSALYIAGLKQVPRPAGIPIDSAPQHPHYWDVDILNGFPPNELEQVRTEKEAEGAFSTSNLEDARKHILAAIVVRQGQSSFRSKLLDAYRSTCAVTGSDVVETLEAAHIVQYLGPKTNDVRNGLLLRADIHTLFDLSLMTLNPSDYQVLVSKRLKGRCYESFAGQKIRLPGDQADYPSPEALGIRLKEFRSKEES